MADQVVAVPLSTEPSSGPTNRPTSFSGKPPTTSAATLSAQNTATDVMSQYNLSEILNEMRSRKLRSSFMHYIGELPTDKIPLKPRCPAGLLAEIAHQPINEDERVLEEFDERVLRAALTLKEGGPPPKMPDWLDEEQPWGDDEKKKKKKDRKKRRRKKKRKRGGGDDDEHRLDDDERRLKKKRK